MTVAARLELTCDACGRSDLAPGEEWNGRGFPITVPLDMPAPWQVMDRGTLLHLGANLRQPEGGWTCVALCSPACVSRWLHEHALPDVGVVHVVLQHGEGEVSYGEGEDGRLVDEVKPLTPVLMAAWQAVEEAERRVAAARADQPYDGDAGRPPGTPKP